MRTLVHPKDGSVAKLAITREEVHIEVGNELAGLSVVNLTFSKSEKLTSESGMIFNKTINAR